MQLLRTGRYRIIPLVLVPCCMSLLLLVVPPSRSIALSSGIGGSAIRRAGVHGRTLSTHGLVRLPPPTKGTNLSSYPLLRRPFTYGTAAAASSDDDPSNGKPDDGADQNDGSSSNNSSESNNNQKVPATGWNHNPPSESSRFWRAPNGASAAARQQQQQAGRKEASSSSTTAPRTGWLHNTKPTTAAPTGSGIGKGRTVTTTTGEGISLAQRRLKRAMRQQQENHRIISPPTFHACGEGRQIVVTEHRISVPVVHPTEGKVGLAGRSSGTVPTTTLTSDRIDVAFTIVEEVTDSSTSRLWFGSLQSMTPTQRAQAYVARAAMANADDMILYLQGGPGFGSPIPVAGLAFSKGSSWGSAALAKYKRIVLLDQRGTGQSTPITKQSLEKRFPNLFLLDGDTYGWDPATTDNLDQYLATVAETRPDDAVVVAKFRSALKEATDFVAQFRADNIVRDAELIREALLVPAEGVDGAGTGDAGTSTVPRPWGCSLGQSYGGFCSLTYLSWMDHPPKVALFTGGIPPVGVHAVDLYTALWAKVKERNLQYYAMYPGDILVVKTIVQKLLVGPPPRLPSGGTLTARRFLQLGMMLGGSPTSFAAMHNLLSSALLQPYETETETEFTRAFLKAVDNAQPFDEHPLYYWLHESIYADGPDYSPTEWSADRSYRTGPHPPSEFDYTQTCTSNDATTPTLFFGEMVFPWMAQDYEECGGTGCIALAYTLASKTDWPNLYDPDHIRAVLDDGKTHCAAAVYYDDMYVDFDRSMNVTRRGGPLEKCKVFITNEYQHSGLRDDGAYLFDKLHGMATGSVRTPS